MDELTRSLALLKIELKNIHLLQLLGDQQLHTLRQLRSELQQAKQGSALDRVDSLAFLNRLSVQFKCRVSCIADLSELVHCDCDFVRKDADCDQDMIPIDERKEKNSDDCVMQQGIPQPTGSVMPQSECVMPQAIDCVMPRPAGYVMPQAIECVMPRPTGCVMPRPTGCVMCSQSNGRVNWTYLCVQCCEFILASNAQRAYRLHVPYEGSRANIRVLCQTCHSRVG